MRCLECDADLDRMDNRHLLECCGLTVHEYALRHHLPLDLILHPDQIDVPERLGDLPVVAPKLRPGSGAVLTGLQLAGVVSRERGLVIVEGSIRGLERLLWDLEQLQPLGFRYFQEFRYEERGHRVVALNRLKALADPVPAAELNDLDERYFRSALAVAAAHCGELHAGYLFLRVADARAGAQLARRMDQDLTVGSRVLPDPAGGAWAWVRCRTVADTDRLLALLEPDLRVIPAAVEQFYDEAALATVAKAMDFDSAHFITDHPGKCQRLHGGRYTVEVRVRDRIDPMTGFVVDYGYLKAVMQARVIEHLDHQNLNYTGPELAWRSSTELLCIHIWERLIDYLPGLKEIQIHETAQSNCRYTGPTLDALQKHGSHPMLRYFSDPGLGRSELRRQLKLPESGVLRVVSAVDKG